MAGVWGPRGGKMKTVLFVDDIGLPRLDRTESQPTLELVRQLIETGGFYNVDKPGEFTKVIDMRVMRNCVCFAFSF